MGVAGSLRSRFLTMSGLATETTGDDGGDGGDGGEMPRVTGMARATEMAEVAEPAGNDRPAGSGTVAADPARAFPPHTPDGSHSLREPFPRGLP
ncbi:hypothetical protein GCM10018952_28770 [Streptosporangium vulgare]